MFEVQLPGPIDVAASLEPFRRWGDDLIDRWDGERLVRTLPVGNRSIAFLATPAGTIDRPMFRVTLEDTDDIAASLEAIRSTFLTPPSQFGDLLATDPVIARLDGLFPGLRPVLQLDLLSALVRCISAQQVNLRWAAITRRRLVEAFGNRHLVGGEIVYSLNAERLAGANVAEIRALQFTSRKAEYLIEVAGAVAGGKLSLPDLATLPDEEVISRLTALRGIGLWSAEWILARTLGRPRVVAGDLGVRKAVGLAYLGKTLPSEGEVCTATAHWGASAAIAQQLLLHGLSQGLLGCPG
ncbi:MAG: DNA-3-methyladenine glycosylase family protein [Chloroflexota bacterium]|jgi:DNA-3-methyladenine glycosylase II